MNIGAGEFTAAIAAADQLVEEYRNTEPDVFLLAGSMIETTATAVCDLLGAKAWSQDFRAGMLVAAAMLTEPNTLTPGFVSQYTVTRSREDT